MSVYDTAPQGFIPFGDRIPVSDSPYAINFDDEYSVPPRDSSVVRDSDEPSADSEEINEVDDVEMRDAGRTQEVEPSTLEYARSNGLTISYLKRCPLRSALIPTPPGSVFADLADDQHVTQHERDEQTVLQQVRNERWDIDKVTAEFLTSVMSLSRIEDFEEGMPCLTVGDLKIDEPVMHSDPDFDIARLRARNMVNLSVTGIEPCRLSVDKGQSLHWPTKDLQLPASVSQSIADEKLNLDKDTTLLLQDAMRPAVLDHWDAIEQAITTDEVELCT